MSGSASLVVGLGNPGEKYAATRHNVGFRVLDRLSDRLHAVGAEPTRLAVPGELGEGPSQLVRFTDPADDTVVLLLKPGHYMNRSGGPALAVVDAFELRIETILVVFDDLDLPVGRLRLRSKGSSAGHRGAQDMIDCLGTDDFARLKVGIDRPSTSTLVTDCVEVLQRRRSKDAEKPPHRALRRTPCARIFRKRKKPV